MKLLLEQWRGYLTEQEDGLPQIYCDMDGVLVDFEQGITDQINKDLKAIRSMKDTKNLLKIRKALEAAGRDEIIVSDLRGKGATSKPVQRYMYGRVGNDATFWADLLWMPGGKELWAFIAPYKPHILTSPMKKGSEYGKTMWIHEHLGLSKEQKVYMSDKKYNWAVNEDGSSNILIDDWSNNIDPWDGHGGIAIQHVNGNTAATKAALRELGFS
jgi:hypothetical protein